MRILCLLVLAANLQAAAQPLENSSVPRRTPEMYVELYREAAISDMRISGVPASITLAQGIYESDCGNSLLALEANNHFGIKCHREWSGPTFHKDDDAPNECFRKYNSVLESYADHSDFLRSRERYRSLFDLEVTDYKGWAHGLKRAGYATNPRYAHKLIEIIERFGLSVYDDPSVSVPALAVRTQPVGKAEQPAVLENESPKELATETKTAQSGKSRRPLFRNSSKQNTMDESTVIEPEVTGNTKSTRPTIFKRKNDDNADGLPKSGKSLPVAEPPVMTADMVNGVPYVTVREGDTWSRIARDRNIELWQVLEFNDAVKNQPLHPGDVVYTAAKKNKSESEFFHVVGQGETMRDISQRHAVKLSKLYRMNELEYGEQPAPGTKIYLQRAMLLGVIL